MKLGNRIKRLREEKGFTGAKFCSGIISPSHFSNIENSRYTPSSDTILLIAERLSVPSFYLLNVYDDDSELEKLLQTLDLEVERGNLQEIKKILSVNTSTFDFISSLRQELYFDLLKFLANVKLNLLDEAKYLYQSKLSKITVDSTSLSQQLREKYYHVSGLYHYYNKDYEKSIFYYKKVLEIKENPFMTAKISFNIALALINLYRYHEALNYSEIANNLYLHMHNWEKTGDCYNMIALLYREQRMLEESEDYIRKGFSIAGEKSDLLHARLYHNLSLIQKDRGDYLKAIESIEKSIQLKERSSMIDIYLSYQVKLNILILKEDIIQLKRLLPVAGKFVKTQKDKGDFLFVQAKMNYLLEEFTRYEDLVKRSIAIFTVEKDLKNITYAANHYANFLEKKKSYKKALEYQKLSITALREIYQEEY